MKNFLIGFLISLSIGFGYLAMAQDQMLGGSGYESPLASRISSYATSGVMYSIGSASRVMLATSTTRTYAQICNMTQNASVMLSFGETANYTTGGGHYLAPNECYYIQPGRNLFTGTIEAIASSTQAAQVPLSVTAAQ